MSREADSPVQTIVKNIKAGNMPSKEDCEHLIEHVIPIFLRESTLLEVEPPINVCGDVHGQLYDLMRLFEMGGWPGKSSTRYLFLGDYVDRGQQSIATISLLFAYKIMHPQQLYLLRGNHESVEINSIYGFQKECVDAFKDKTMWGRFNQAFDCMPLAGLVGERVLCMHGGLSPDLKSLDQIRRIKRPIPVPAYGLINDLLWADPHPMLQGFYPNPRGVSHVFGPDVVQEMCSKLQIDLVIRAHQLVHDGYEFFAENRLVTLFSAPDYGGRSDNAAAMMFIDENLVCNLLQIKSSEASPSMQGTE